MNGDYLAGGLGMIVLLVWWVGSSELARRQRKATRRR